MSDFAIPRATDRQAPLSMGILQAGILEWVAMPSSRGSSKPRIKPKSPALLVDSLPSESQGKLAGYGHVISSDQENESVYLRKASLPNKKKIKRENFRCLHYPFFFLL